jgi:hypothetical protein
MSDSAVVIIEETTKTPKESKPLEVTKAMSLLITNAVNEIEAKKAKRQAKKAEKIVEPKEHKKTKKELEIEAKAHLVMCKGKTKDNKECTRKESENCNGFCKQHFNIQKDKENTIELIEKLKK